MTHASIDRLRAFDENGKLKRSSREKPLREKSHKKRAQPETSFQMKLVVALRRQLPDGSLVYHVPNQAALHQKNLTIEERKKRTIFLKQMGMVVGMPDLLVLVPYRPDQRVFGPRTFAIECKAGGGALSESQVQVAEQLGRMRVPYFLARDVESALKWIGDFVQLKEAKGAKSCE